MPPQSLSTVRKAAIHRLPNMAIIKVKDIHINKRKKDHRRSYFAFISSLYMSISYIKGKVCASWMC